MHGLQTVLIIGFFSPLSFTKCCLYETVCTEYSQGCCHKARRMYLGKMILLCHLLVARGVTPVHLGNSSVTQHFCCVFFKT